MKSEYIRIVNEVTAAYFTVSFNTGSDRLRFPLMILNQDSRYRG
jgi:hypothetical protein